MPFSKFKLFTINMLSQLIWLRTDKKALQHLVLRTTKLSSLQPCHVYHHLVWKWWNITISMLKCFLNENHPYLSWCPPWCHPPLIFLPLSFRAPLLDKKYLVFTSFSEIQVPIPWFKTFDFWKHLSRYGVMTLSHYTWKHSQIYYNEVYHIYMSLYASYIRVNTVKQNSQVHVI